MAPGFASPARGAEVLAYLELPADAPPDDVARIVDAIRLVGGELLDLATGPPFRPRTTFLAAVSEPAFVALSAAAGIGSFPVSYTNVLGGWLPLAVASQKPMLAEIDELRTVKMPPHGPGQSASTPFDEVPDAEMVVACTVTTPLFVRMPAESVPSTSMRLLSMIGVNPLPKAVNPELDPVPPETSTITLR